MALPSFRLLGFICVPMLVEAAHWIAARLAIGDRSNESGSGDTEAIIVLGYPSRVDGRPHPLQIWRADIAVRSADPHCQRTLYVASGAAVRRDRPEAEVLAELLQLRGVDPDDIVIEDRARSTWENLEYSIPLVTEADRYVIASNPLHAWRARKLLRRQNPAAFAKLRRAKDYRCAERLGWKFHSLVYEIIGGYREWRHPRLPDRVSQ